MKLIPVTLIYTRIVIGLILVALGLLHVDHYALYAITLVTIGLLTDIFDGIIARRLGISTEKMRRLDSAVDQVFWILVIISAFIQYPDFFYRNYLLILTLLASEALIYVVSFIRFRKEVATHAIASKIWTLFLFATLIEVLATGNSGILFLICFYLGVLTRFEIIAILLILRAWTNDVPSVYHAVLIRQGKPVKRNKLFNG